jgi:UDP-GlcNAc3NAcA epimerase
MQRKKIITIIGARPQFVKAAVLSRLIKSDEWNSKFEEILVHTGQHYDKNMSDVFFDEMGIPYPKYNLEIGSGSHGKMTGEMLIRLEEVLLTEEPDIVLVYGDTNSTLAGALAAAKLNIPVAHIEAGLRSFWKKMPEEQNRIVTDHLSTTLFCPTTTAVKNLKAEGITKGVHNVGDIMLDAHLHYSMVLKERNTTTKNGLNELDNLNIPDGEEFYLLTIHRAENTDSLIKLSSIVDAINSVPKIAVIPLHPRTKKQMNKFGLQFNDHVKVINPVGFLDFLSLLLKCSFVVTDSGGIQKEAFFAKKPCITLREQTEWIETVNSGWNKTIGTNRELIIESLLNINMPSLQEYEFGNGKAGSSILDLMETF